MRTDQILFPDMSLQRTRTEPVPDHEILLAFRDRYNAEMFSRWLQGDGWAAFSHWADEQRIAWAAFSHWADEQGIA
jgi:hypothetical protein